MHHGRNVEINAKLLYQLSKQSNLYGNQIILESLSDNSAVVLMKSIIFALYHQTAHIKQQISSEDFRKIFETRWIDKAIKAGWDLKIEYKSNEEIVFNFMKK